MVMEEMDAGSGENSQSVHTAKQGKGKGFSPTPCCFGKAYFCLFKKNYTQRLFNNLTLA